MNRYKFISISILLLVVINKICFSQITFTINAGTSIPVGDFAIDDPWNDKSGLAGTGMVAGIQCVYPLNEKGLGFLSSVDFILNPTSNDARKKWEDFNNEADFKFPRAINIPVSAGINYIFTPDEKISLYGKAALSASFLKFTGFMVQQYGYEDYTEEYDFSAALGFILGTGIKANKISIGFNYMILGEHKTGGIWKEGPNTGKLEQEIRNISLITLTAGWNF